MLFRSALLASEILAATGMRVGSEEDGEAEAGNEAQGAGHGVWNPVRWDDAASLPRRA